MMRTMMNKVGIEHRTLQTWNIEHCMHVSRTYGTLAIRVVVPACLFTRYGVDWVVHERI